MPTTPQPHADSEAATTLGSTPSEAVAPSAAASPSTPSGRLSRRGFLRGLGGAAAAAGFAGVGSAPLLAPRAAEAFDISPTPPRRRRQAAWTIRRDRALEERQESYQVNPCNRDEALYDDFRAQYSKALPHNSRGEVDPQAYALLLAALSSGESEDFSRIPTGGPGRLANPQAAYAYEMVGADPHRLLMPPAPRFASAEQGAEMVEVYWQALLRDVPFTEYESDPLANAAADDLSRFPDYPAPRDGGRVTPGNLFRGDTPGDLVGPYLSQYLWKAFPYGMTSFEQKYRTPVDGDDYMTDPADWLAVQRGILPPSAVQLRSTPRYLVTGRDLSEYVHRDFSYQAFLNAALYLLTQGGGALDVANPYRTYLNQGGFVTFGAAGILDIVAKAANAALKAAWYQKWLVHRRVRPEAYAGRVHFQLTSAKDYDLPQQILTSPVLDRVLAAYGTYLLPQAFPEGSPTHPSYPAGHATIAGACVTVLKAYFDESYVLPQPVVPDPTGSTLLPWTGEDLTLGGELNKLAANISLGRDIAGVHWRTDGVDGMLLGEKVAIEILRDTKTLYTEREFAGFTLTTFEGETLTL